MIYNTKIREILHNTKFAERETHRFSNGRRHDLTHYYIDQDVAREIFRILFDLYGPPDTPSDFMSGRDDLSSGSIYLEIERAWAVSANINVRLGYDHQEFPKDDKIVHVYGYRVETSVSWGSTGRSTTQARACTKLYNEMIELAEAIEITFADLKILVDTKEVVQE